jgi:hypothetical protein
VHVSRLVRNASIKNAFEYWDEVPCTPASAGIHYTEMTNACMLDVTGASYVGRSISSSSQPREKPTC